MKTHPQYEPWLQGMLIIAKYYRLDFSAEHVRVTINHESQSPRQLVLEEMARQLGLGMRWVAAGAVALDPWRLPLLAEFTGGQIAVINRMDNEGNVSVQFSGDGGLETTLTRDELGSRLKGLMVLRPLESTPDARVDDYIKPYEKNWFWQLALKDWRRYSDIMLVALVANVLALSGMVFSMQVYDRVIPAQSYPTLYVLTIGVLIATLFGFVLRVARGHIMDLLGKRSDLRVSDRVFGHALRLRHSAIPRSTGSFISQLRELEQIREMVTSSTISTIVDLPFFILFVIVLAIIAPQLAWIAPVAAVIMVLPGLLLQKKLAELAKQSAHESTLRNAVLVESVQGLEDIKLMQAENRFLQQWNSYIQITAESGLRTRELTQNLISWGMTIQSLVYAGVIVVGAPMVIDGTLTTGSVVAASMLASRMIAPMATLCGVLARWQQVKAAKEGLDSIMQLPTENQREETPIRQDVLRGHYLFEQAQFRYHPEDPRMALRINRLEIKAGEKVAILGRNGAGKSTLLQAMAGGMDLAGGELRLDNLSLPHLDVADVRRNVGFMTQNARLFYGTLRENITLGMPRATDKEIFEVLEMCGAASFVQKLPKGLDYPIMENGVGLSGGQRQSILLARMLLRDPNIVLMDEPTASLDEHTEREFIQRLGAWLGNRTLIVATHRVPVLELVERVVVLKDGMLVMDAPKAQALNNSRMQQQQQATGREWKNENQSA